MSRLSFRLAPFAFLLTLVPAISTENFHDLFDGKSLDGWVVDGPAKGKTGRMMWSVEDGRIVCLGEGFGFLRYDRRQFSDFTVRVEYRFSPRQGANSQGNSGIGIRTERFDPNRSRETRPSYAAYEVQLLDDAGSATFGTRDRVTLSVHEPDRQPGAAGSRVEHDRGRVPRGPRILVRLNGQTVLEADQSELADVKTRPGGVPAPKDKPRRGYIALQSHSGRVEFRKVQIREQ